MTTIKKDKRETEAKGARIEVPEHFSILRMKLPKKDLPSVLLEWDNENGVWKVYGKRRKIRKLQF